MAILQHDTQSSEDLGLGAAPLMSWVTVGKSLSVCFISVFPAVK